MLDVQKANIEFGIHMCFRVLFQRLLRPALTVAACFWLEPRPHQTKANYLFEKLVYLMVHVSTEIDTECCFSCLKRNNHVTSYKGIKRESSRYRHSKLILNVFLSALMSVLLSRNWEERLLQRTFALKAAVPCT